MPVGQYPESDLEAAAEELEQYKAEILREGRERAKEKKAKDEEERLKQAEEERNKMEERRRVREAKLAAKRKSMEQSKEQRKALVQQQRDARKATVRAQLDSRKEAAEKGNSAATPRKASGPEYVERNRERVKQKYKELAAHSKIGREQYRLERQQRIDAILRDKEATKLQQGKESEIAEPSEDLSGQSRTVQGQRKQDEKADENPSHSRDRSRRERDGVTTPQADEQSSEAIDNNRQYQSIIEQQNQNQDRTEEGEVVGKEGRGEDPESPLLKQVNEPGSASIPSPNRMWSSVVDGLDDASKQLSTQLSAAARQGLAGVPSFPKLGSGSNDVAVP